MVGGICLSISALIASHLPTLTDDPLDSRGRSPPYRTQRRTWVVGSDSLADELLRTEQIFRRRIDDLGCALCLRLRAISVAEIRVTHRYGEFDRYVNHDPRVWGGSSLSLVFRRSC